MVKKDGCGAWVILGACALNCAVSVGVAMGCGVYITTMISHYGSSRLEGYVVGALAFGLLLGTGPLASVIVDRSSHRTVAMIGGGVSCIGLVLSANVPSIPYMYLTFGIITGFGCGLVFTPSLTAPMFYFDAYRSVASGLVNAGSAAGTLLFPVISQQLIDTFSWQPSLYIVAGICLNMCVGGALIRPVHLSQDITIDAEELEEVLAIHEPSTSPQDESIDGQYTESAAFDLSENREKQSYMLEEQITIESDVDVGYYSKSNEIKDFSVVSDTDTLQNSEIPMPESAVGRVSELYLVTNLTFIMSMLSVLLNGCSVTSVFIVTPDIYRERGISPSNQAIMFIVMGVCNIVGRIVGGPLWLRCFSATTLYTVTSAACGLGVWMYMFNANMVSLIFANVIFGIVYGIRTMTWHLLLIETVGMKYMNRAMGYSCLVGGIGSIIGSPLLGAIYDATQDYMWPILMGAIFAFLAAAAMMPNTPIWRSRTGCRNTDKSTRT